MGKESLKTYARAAGFRRSFLRRKVDELFPFEVMAFNYFLATLAAAEVSPLKLSHNELATKVLDAVTASMFPDDDVQRQEIKLLMAARSKVYMGRLQKLSEHPGPGTAQGAMALADEFLQVVHKSTAFLHRKLELASFIRGIYRDLRDCICWEDMK